MTILIVLHRIHADSLMSLHHIIKPNMKVAFYERYFNAKKTLKHNEHSLKNSLSLINVRR